MQANTLTMRFIPLIPLVPLILPSCSPNRERFDKIRDNAQFCYKDLGAGSWVADESFCSTASV